MPSTTETGDRHLSELIATATEALIEAEEALHELAERITMLERSLGFSTNPSITPLLPKRQRKRTSVGKARLQAVRDCIERHGEARQADIVKDLNLNSGTVSVATNALQTAGEIEAVGKERGSVIWRFTGKRRQKPDAQPRAGEGVEAGRKAPQVPSNASIPRAVVAPTSPASSP